MTLLEWTWTLRFGQYARATFASQPVLLVVPFGAALLLALVLRGDLGGTGAVVAFVATVVLTTAVMLLSVALGLRRLRAATRSSVQSYAITQDAVDVALGEDRYSLPRAELSVARSGSDWIAVRRRAMGTRRLILFFDDPLLVPQALGLLRPRAGTHRS